MTETVTVESHYEVYYETEFTLPKGYTTKDIENVVHKWCNIWIQFKDGKEFMQEQNFDMNMYDDGKWPWKLRIRDEGDEEVLETHQ